MPSDSVSRQDEAGAWRLRSAELAFACAGSSRIDEAARLRELAVLLATAPAGLSRGLTQPDPRAVELFAQSGAVLVAVLETIERAGCGYLLSYGGGHMASVALPDQDEDVTASGETAALAAIGALALALSETGEAQLIPSDICLCKVCVLTDR